GSIGSPSQGNTGIGQAFDLADNIIRRESTSEKSVIILSDGYDNCSDGQHYGIARRWRSSGVKIMYVVVGAEVNRDDILNVAGDIQNTKKVDKMVLFKNVQ
ncbi:hypothetical protein TELCIR_12030, partial [Teladorsagia circumcincta]